MARDSVEASQQKAAKLAGVLFPVVFATFFLRLLITQAPIVPGDFSESAANILASEHFYRTGLSVQVFYCLLVVLLGWALYVLLRPVHADLALLALAGRLAEATLSGVMALINFAILGLYTSPDFQDAFEPAQVTTLLGLLSEAHRTGFTISAIFFAPASLVFFYLLFESRYIPKPLSAFGVVASLIVLVGCFASLILSEHAGLLLQLGLLPVAIAEVAAGFWLLFKGVSIPAPVLTDTGRG